MALPRGVPRVIYCSPQETRGRKGKPSSKVWHEYLVLVRPHRIGLAVHKSKAGTVKTDLEFVKRSWRMKGRGLPQMHDRKLKLTPVVGRMKLRRADLRVKLPKHAGWHSPIIATRVFGWYFLNSMKLSWTEYTRPHPVLKHSYYWQIHHTNKGPSMTLAAELNIMIKHTSNEKDWRRVKKTKW